MRTTGIQSLIVLTDPACVFALDLVNSGHTCESAVAALVSRRLGLSVEHTAEVIDGLVGIGWIERAGLDRIASKGIDDFDEHCREGLDHLAWLRAVGDDEHAADTVGAILAAWDTRSTDPFRRRRGALFRESEAGRRHAARVRARSLGFAFADPDVDSATDDAQFGDERLPEAG
ncbi:hypothetical protein [Frondihabitans australicus]|nr:hypothetical protein [Frondihabitans australicus]